MINYTDAHCHVMSASPCPDALAGRICNATAQDEWAKISETVNDKNFACIGIHPWNIESIAPDWESELYDMLVRNPILMVGETGMDKYHPNIETQEKIFISQMQIASKLRRPVHLHCVGAWDKILHIFKELYQNMPPVIVAHAFNGDESIITQLAEKYNVYFSYSTPNDARTIARITHTPTQRLLIESDAHDEQTEIQTIEDASNTIAKILGQDDDLFVEQIYQNFQRVISYVRPIDN